MYVPDITSYDYDAPMTEAGDPTPKYMDIRRAIGKVFYPILKLNLGAFGFIEFLFYSISHYRTFPYPQ